MTVTFFGHADTPQDISPKIKQLLISCIENQNASHFYVGTHGNFDCIVRSTLHLLKQIHPHIQRCIVLAYLTNNAYVPDGFDTVYPEGLETIPQRFAIPKRNRWMIEKSDIVITYVTHDWGNAARYKELALRLGKTVIELADFV